MKCPECNGENIQINQIQTSSKSRHSGVGFGGNFNNIARGITAVSTLGVSNLVWRKSKGGSKQKFKLQKVAVCQSCGHDWRVR